MREWAALAMTRSARPRLRASADRWQQAPDFVKQRIGNIKTPKQIEVWDDLPRSKVGKVLKPDIRARLSNRSGG